MTFSSYKNHNTFKPLGITFISSLYPGSISDQQLTKKSGLLDLLEKEDSVMADRGFNIHDLTPLLPASMKDRSQILKCRGICYPFFAMSAFLLENSATSMGSTFLGLGLFHCCNLSAHVRNSGSFPDAQNFN